jgi:hypothetical protein
MVRPSAALSLQLPEPDPDVASFSGRRGKSPGSSVWRSEALQPAVEEISAPAVMCLCWEASSKSHLGEIASSRATMAEAISLAKELNDIYGLAVVLSCSGVLAHMERNLADVERYSWDLIELSTRHHFARDGSPLGPFTAVGCAVLPVKRLMAPHGLRTEYEIFGQPARCCSCLFIWY